MYIYIYVEQIKSKGKSEILHVIISNTRGITGMNNPFTPCRFAPAGCNPKLYNMFSYLESSLSNIPYLKEQLPLFFWRHPRYLHPRPVNGGWDPRPVGRSAYFKVLERSSCQSSDEPTTRRDMGVKMAYAPKNDKKRLSFNGEKRGTWLKCPMTLGVQEISDATASILDEEKESLSFVSLISFHVQTTVDLHLQNLPPITLLQLMLELFHIGKDLLVASDFWPWQFAAELSHSASFDGFAGIRNLGW